jgi:hypothetical protein
MKMSDARKRDLPVDRASPIFSRPHLAVHRADDPQAFPAEFLK